MTILPRIATTTEKAKARSDNQSSRSYLTVHAPATVYMARLATLPTSNDRVSSIAYNSGSGGLYTDLLPDMTIYVSAIGFGKYDLGMVRLRNITGLGATSGVFQIGRTSSIVWSANAYLTVVDEFGLWPRWPETDGSGVVAMDTDVAYVNQHRYCASVPIFPRYAVKWLTGATVNVIRDGSQSWALNNTINSYQWEAWGMSAISGDTTDTVTITYDTPSGPGGYRTALTVGNTDSVDFTGYGRVWILQNESDAITQFKIEDCSGDFTSGGWSAKITCYAEADLTTIRDRALCIIHRRDWYGRTDVDEGSIGYVADDENIEMIGWIAGETIQWKSTDQASSVTFTIYGPQYWLDNITMPTVGLKNISSFPTNWKRFQGLTAKSATWHTLMWRTTAPRCMDCFSIENGWAALQLQSGGAQTVWQQLSNILNDFLLAKPCCDAYGRLFMQREQNLLTATDRSSIPTVMTITTGDWSNQVDFDRRETNVIAGVDIIGEIYNGTNTTTAVYALSPGRVFADRGSSIYARARLTVDTQGHLNELAGTLYGWKINPYPRWRFSFPSNFHLIDLAPYQYLDLSLAAGDTPRGIALTSLRLIPRRIQRIFRDGYIRTEFEVEAESIIYDGITGDTPAAPPELPATPPPAVDLPPDPIPTPAGEAREMWMFATDAIYWSADVNTGGQLTWNQVAGAMPDAGVPSYGAVTRDGETIFMVYDQAANKGIYKCDNPRDAVPVWTDILVGESSGIYPYELTPANFDFGMRDNTFWCYARAAGESAFNGYHVGHYAAGAWSWSVSEIPQVPASTYVGKSDLVMTNGDDWRTVPAFALLSTSTGYGAHSGDRFNVWSWGVGDHVGLVSNGGTNAFLYIPQTGAVLTAMTGFLWNGAQRVYGNVYGSETGNRVFIINPPVGSTDAGAFWIGDTTGVARMGSWTNAQRIHDAALAGGGTLWITLSFVTGSNEMIRRSTDGGVTWVNYTGDFWSVASGDQTFINSGMVYV